MASQSLARPNIRSDSLRSVSSTNSAVSLTRRSRIRTRSGTLSDQRGRSLGPRDEEKESANNLSVELAASYPLQSPQPGPSSHENQVLTPSRPKKSTQRIADNSEMGIASSKVHKRPATVETSMGTERGRNQTAGPSQLKGAIRPRSLPRKIRSFSSDSSLENPIELPIENASNHQGSNNRDSLLSQQSGTSSSVYPPSTATMSKRDRTLSPTSHKGKTRDEDIPPLEPEDDHGYQDFDADDVSLRLRLLVNNNYFLPPAHSKPSAADFANSNAAKQKAPSPGFLDLFRIGKSKSKPTTPTVPSPPTEYTVDKMKPVSNGTPTSPFFRQQQSLPQTPITHAQPGRVVVVREKMQDLVSAAKQAELENKNRGDHNSHPSKNSKKRFQEQFDGVIDPTDSVDLPPPSGNYPFALQASAMQGLGIQDSIGAAVLADRLPPPQSPGLWSVSTDDEVWRKRILQQAVGHSFSNTTVSSFTRKSSGRSTDTGISVMTTHPGGTVSSEPDYESASSPVSIRSSSPRLPLGQPIVSQAVLNRHVQHSPSMSRLVSRPEHPPSPRLLRKFSAPEFQQGTWNSFDPPLRAESPLHPTTPLAPAPRKPIFNPVYSLSQSDLGDPLEGERISSPAPSAHSSSRLRSSIASGRLPDVHETEVNTGRSAMSPPPVFVRGPEGSPVFSSHRPPTSETSGSHYFEDDDIEETWYGTPGDSDDLARLSTSLPTTGRPSLSDQTYASPTVSAFRDAIFDDHRSISSLQAEISAESSVQSFVSAMSAPRYSMASPPPRASSSFAAHGLPPPPRRPRPPPEQARPEIQDRILILGPESATVPFPNSDRRGNRLSSLHIPTLSDSQIIKSAPPDSSISFFDNIQSDLNEMDEDSDSASDEGVSPIYVDPRTKAISNRPSISSLRPSFMRLGNNSLPQLGSYAGLPEQYPPFDLHTMKTPIINVPERPAFFASRKGGKNKHGISPLDFAPLPTISSPTLSGRSSQASLKGRKRSGSGKSQKSEFVIQTSQDESMRNLDGLVMKHLEAERDTLARIAANTRTKRKLH